MNLHAPATRHQRRQIIRLSLQHGIKALDVDDRQRAFAFVAHAETACTQEDADRIIRTLAGAELHA